MKRLSRWAVCNLGLLGTGAPPLAQSGEQDSSRIRLALASDDEFELEAFWEPCRESKYDLFEESEPLRNVEPAEERQRHGAEEFAALLPREQVAVGDVWEVDAAAVLPFLRQFHPGARAELHHGFGAAPGTYACLRAADPRRAEVLFRAHAEFELANGVLYTPAQFEGRIVLDHIANKLVSFHLALPSRNPNVDVNVPMEFGESPEGPRGKRILADIGWVPRMELVGRKSMPVEGTRSISDDDARALLARRFYAFEAIEWRPFEEAVLRARELGKPLHVVVLFGALDDESC